MFEGVFTAIITPFKEDGSVDEECLKRLIDFNIENGISGIVPCGTTGESPTLSHDEHDRVIELTVQHVNKRVPVIAGTGSNSTAEAIRLTKHAEEAGADGCLVVNPYYNKPTQEGLYRHFKAVADSVKAPIVVYNIKGRTGVNVETPTLMRLVKDCANIKAVKEASGDINQMKDVISQRPEGFSVLSGDDNITLELIKAGGNGVISVASNIIPDRMSAMVKAALEGNFELAEKLNDELAPFFGAEFIETNPIPIKAALAMKGMCNEVYRLPMCELRPENREKLKKVLAEMGIIS
ncbi:4-hydroxy-tetrahydrodipicolinate synthase [Candidatus Woesearchaeota archaeon]|nr:4-hydroxy-tetrahydrodipicolinate synthase [Candidatus Woesearchaeota archaeon]